MTFDPDLAADRLPLWKALSELFLDSELDDGDVKLIASAIAESGLALPEAERILWEEVFPALGANLQVPAGAWGGFDGESLRDRIVSVALGRQSGIGSLGVLSARAAREIIEEAWSRVRAHLPPGTESSGDTP